MKSFVVIGIGRFGSALVETLRDIEFDVLAVDKDHDAIAGIAEYATHAVECDVRDGNALRSLGLGNFDAAVVSIGSDLEASIMATMILKEEGVPKIIAKAQSNLHAKVLSRLGADRIVFPERDMGIRVAHSLVSPNIEDYISLSSNHGILEISVLSEWVGQTLGEVKMRNKYNVNVVAIQRQEEIIVNPRADLRMQHQDKLVVIGSSQALNRLEGLIADET